jgi:hypothetical protein
MRQPMTTRERVLITLTVCFALIAVPMTALAAVGQLVNIADSTNASRIAKVTDVGALQVQTRPGIPTNSFNKGGSRGSVGWLNIHEQSAGRRLAVVELSLNFSGPAGTYAAYVGHKVLNTGQSCDLAAAGTNFRTFRFTTATTVQFDFSGAPALVGSVATGKKICLGVYVVSMPSGAQLHAGMSGYSYVP